jgi:hypothetical protein
VAVVTDAGTLTGWNIPMTMKHSPAIMADKPAKRISVDVVIFGLLFLLVLLLMFICLSPSCTVWIRVREWHPAFMPIWVQLVVNIKQNMGRCLPHMWGFVWGYAEKCQNKLKNPPELNGRVHRIPDFTVRF